MEQESPEVTGAALLLMGPQGGSSVSMQLVDGRMDLDVRIGILPISLEMQRTIQKVRNWALYVSAVWPSEKFSDNRGVVRPLNKDQVDCISAGLRRA